LNSFSCFKGKALEFAENYAIPLAGELQPHFRRDNEFGESFFIRWGRMTFQVRWGVEANLKVILKVFRNGDGCEHFIVDTDAVDTGWNSHKRITRDFFVHPFPRDQEGASCVKYSYIVHLQGRAIPSRYDYIFMDRRHIEDQRTQCRPLTDEWVTPNTYQTGEIDAGLLQRDADWYNHHFESLQVIPKFTKGQPDHPYHPKQFIHDQIDRVIGQSQGDSPARAVKVCVDCIDEGDFVSHLMYARSRGVRVQCLVDWRKMMLTNSGNYLRLKRSGIELMGVFCTRKHPLMEVAPDMHNKFIIFGEENCLLGSFNITFDRWGNNWESGLSFHSRGVCRMLDNVFQSIRGGIIQPYGVDPLSPFNLFYTLGRQFLLNGKGYGPHQAIISEIHRARASIKACLFLLGELQGEYGDSVVEALIQARNRGVDVRILFNGHMARQGNPARAYSPRQEWDRPLLPAVERLHRAGMPIALVYGLFSEADSYSPLHSKYCIIDDQVVLDGSFNWYNTSVFSHDLLVVLRNHGVALQYLYEFDQILRRFKVYWL
jgi:hypothetical protein